MKKRQILSMLLASTMLLATGCDEEAITTAVLENLESALVSGPGTDGEETDQSANDGSTDVAKADPVTTDPVTTDPVTTEPVKSKRTNVYQSIPIALPDEIGEGTGYVQDMVSIGDRIYMEYVQQNDDASETWLYSTDVTGENQTFVPFQDPLEGSGYMTKLYTTDEKLYALYETWYDNNVYWLMELDPTDGSVTKQYDLNVAKDALGLTDEDSFYVVDVALSGHTVYLNRYTELIPYDLQTETCGDVIELPENIMGFASTYGTDEGIYFTAYNEQYEQNFYILDPATGTATPTWIGDPGYFAPIGMCDGLLYFNTYDAVLTYDFEHGHVGEVLDFRNCDIHPNEVTYMVITADGTLVYFTSLDDGRISRIGGKLQTLERIPDDQLPEEVLLTIATTYYDYSLEDAVLRYNRQTDGVHIAIQDYSYMADGEHDAAYWICKNIIDGEAPDLVLLDRYTPVERYYKNGLLVDLYPYMDGAENGIDRSQYFENIFKACERDGKLYALITNYSLETMAAKSAYVGSDAGWSLSEMLDTIEAMPDGMRAFSGYGRDDLLAQLMQYCGELFIDWERSTTNFASEDFLRLLTFLKTYPEKSVLNAYYEDAAPDTGTNFMREYDMRFYKDTALLETAYIYEVRGYWDLFRTFAENPTVIGYPTNESSGTIVRPTLELGIGATSVNKDSAWDFLRYLLTSEDDLEIYESFLPISKARFEKLVDGSEAYYAGWYTYSEDEYDYMRQEYGEEYVTYHRQANQPYTKEMGQKVYDLAAGATKVTRMTDGIIAIIQEEASAYFSDSQTVEEAVKCIDDRVCAYMDDHK